MATIKLYLKGNKVAEREWEQVPREGDSIMLYGRMSGTYKILPPIIWAGETNNQQVLIDIEAI
jgi:hypothetical protein